MKIQIPMTTAFLAGGWKMHDGTPCFYGEKCCMRPVLGEVALWEISFEYYQCGAIVRVERHHLVFRNSVVLKDR